MAASRRLYVNVAQSFKNQLQYTVDGKESFTTYIDFERVMQTIASLARKVADDFAADNPRFDRMKFYAACGLTVSGTPGGLLL